MFIVNVKTENNNEGVFCETFPVLGNEVREFVKARAASFRADRANAKVVAVILRSGDTLSNARILEA